MWSSGSASAFAMRKTLMSSISCIRWKEMRDGVEVYRLAHDAKTGEERKEVLGTSPKAGQMAVMQSAASRVFTNMCATYGFKFWLLR